MTPRIVLSLVAAALATACTAPDLTEEVAVARAALARSNTPPAGLAVAQVPQFVAVTFDDNFSSEGMGWATSFLAPLRNPAGSGRAGTFDGTPVRTSFFYNSLYLDGTQAAWQVAVNDGHETGDHTVNHPFALSYDAASWSTEVNNCRSALASRLGLPLASVRGFRTPYLAYNDALFGVLTTSPAFEYDTSIQSGWADGESGGNAPWPYTLDAGSPDAATVVQKFGTGQAQPVNAHPGLWELPVTTMIVPPDAQAAAYGFTPGLRTRLASALAGKSVPSFYEASTGKLAGLDITMIVDGGMTKAEALATLEYTLDQHLAGNRAPFILVAHTHVYASGYGAAANVQNTADRRAIIEQFVAYALSKPQVRMRPLADVMAWMKAPVALGSGTCTPVCSGRSCGGDGCGGSCGTCGAGQTCNASGTCQSTCTPVCSGRSCGSDGCGGSCGTCGAGQTCNASGTCQSTCTPTCSGRSCGSDGCGGSCGTCSAGSTCNASFTCQCTPVCSGRTCGTDGCGGSCGTCGAGQNCNTSGTCQSTSGGNCGAAAWSSGTGYAVGAVVTASCQVSTVGTACYQNVGKLFAWRCENAGWCPLLGPGSNQGGWWSAWSSLGSCN